MRCVTLQVPHNSKDFQCFELDCVRLNLKMQELCSQKRLVPDDSKHKHCCWHVTAVFFPVMITVTCLKYKAADWQVFHSYLPVLSFTCRVGWQVYLSGNISKEISSPHQHTLFVAKVIIRLNDYYYAVFLCNIGPCIMIINH